MLQFMIVFLGLLVSIFTENIFTDVGSVLQSTANEKFEAYIDSALQRHLFLLSLCKRDSSVCKSSDIPDTDAFLPAPLAKGDIQKHMYNCLQVIKSGENSELIVLTAYRDLFFQSWGISPEHTFNLVYSLLDQNKMSDKIKFYTDSAQFAASSLEDINSCVMSHNHGNDTSLFFISQKMLKE
ncbi:hypothetical protein DV589_25050 [Salmonella enterica]|nr:hypothetical protein [Salmonella enterica]EKF0975008.1 hypothetical protein [Salmonella enterica]